jgi:hypothetical protein
MTTRRKQITEPAAVLESRDSQQNHQRLNHPERIRQTVSPHADTDVPFPSHYM